MNYTFHQLRVFLEVVRRESITKAAEVLHMTQPALSIQLKNFQGQFEIPLTEVVGRRIHITDFGRSVAEMAEHVFREAEAINHLTREYDGLFAGKLRISSASTGKYVAPFFLSGFLNLHRGIDLSLDVTNKSRVVESLRRSEADFALVSTVPAGLAVEEEIILENKLYLVGDSPQFDRERPFIYREAGSATRAAMDGYLRNTGQRKRLELTSNEAVKQAVLAGLGYSILPLIGLKNELARGELHILPRKNLPIVTHWRFIWLKNKKLSPVASAFLDYIRTEKAAVAEKHFSNLS